MSQMSSMDNWTEREVDILMLKVLAVLGLLMLGLGALMKAPWILGSGVSVLLVAGYCWVLLSGEIR